MKTKGKIVVGLVTLVIAGTVVTIALESKFSNQNNEVNSLPIPTPIVQQEDDSQKLDIGSGRDILITEDQLAGSGSAVMEETNEEDVYVDPVEETPAPETQEGETTEKEEAGSQQQGISAEIKTDGAAENFGRYEPELPTEEDMQWAADLIDQNGTVLH